MKLLINGRIYKKWRHLKFETIVSGEPINASKEEIKRFMEYSRFVNTYKKLLKEESEASFEAVQGLLQEQGKFYDHVVEG